MLIRKHLPCTLTFYQYFFSRLTERGEPTRSIPTPYASPFFKSELTQGSELLPVWPDPGGEVAGYALKTLYKYVPHAVKQDQLLS